MSAQLRIDDSGDSHHFSMTSGPDRGGYGGTSYSAGTDENWWTLRILLVRKKSKGIDYRKSMWIIVNRVS